MQAWLCETATGPDALQWKPLPQTEPKPGEVRVAIRAASLNFPDLLIVQGKYQFKPPLPFVPGSEFAGIVDAVGEGVTHLKPGMAVASFGGLGGFGTHACVNAQLAMPLPPGFDLEDELPFCAPTAPRTMRWSIARNSRPARRCWSSALPAVLARRRSRLPRRWARA